MENSVASVNEALSCSEKTTDDSSEESSWTFYIQDFVCGNDDNSSFSYGCVTTPLVSDAGSSAARKSADNNAAATFTSERSICKKLSFKRHIAKGTPVGDELEDTASSPANSPKISYLNQLNLMQSERDNKNVSQGKITGHNELSIVEGDNGYSKLKKRGLCLVPLSMLGNYLG